MSWEAVSGISGVVSAVVAVVSLLDIRRGKREAATVLDQHRARLSMYLLFSSGWVLCVIAFNWCFDPFGPFVTDREQRVLYGIMLSAPAVTLTLYALRQLQNSPTPDKKSDAKSA